jgi:hypothetical protein
MHAETSGDSELQLDRDEWTWLRFRADNGASTFERVPPLRADARQILELPPRPRMHVLVLASDWQTPRADARVVFHHTDLAPGSSYPTLTTEHRTDPAGVLVLDDLPKGRLVVATDGADPIEPPPATATVMWGYTEGDVGVVLVQAEPRFQLTLHVFLANGAATSPSAVRPKIFLTSVDDAAARHIPQQGVLAAGAQEVEFRVPPGRYQVGVLPGGEVNVLDGAIVEVTAPSANASVSLVPNPSRTTLHLRGPGLSDPPLRVNLEPSNGLRHDDPDLMFVGPVHWQSAEASIPQCNEPCWVTCLGRQRAFISASPLLLNSPRIDAEMVPATCVSVSWIQGAPGGQTLPHLIVTGREETGQDWEAARPFERVAMACPGGRTPALLARIVVPFGRLRLEALAGTRTVWTRECTADSRQLTLEVSGTLP